MKRKIIPFMLITLFTMSSTALAFSDVENHWAKESIDELNKTSIIKGYEDDTFRPDNYMTRAEVATIINRMNGVTKESSKYIPDITRQDWFYSEIRKAVQSGIMQGDENGYTRPNSLITREEAIVMLARAFSIDDISNGVNTNFKDKDEISDWANEAMYTFVTYNYLNGYEDGSIRPKENITRAEFVTIVDRMFSEIAMGGMYTETLSGNMLVIGKSVVLNNLIVNGNLIISEGTKETFIAQNVEVKGNLILRENIDTSEIECIGKKIILYSEDDITYDKYSNEEYGIEFSIPSNAKVVEKWKDKSINYDEEDLIIIDVMQSDEYYLKSIETIAKAELRKVDNNYNKTEQGQIGNIEYILYKEAGQKSKYNLLIIKRDNTIYTLLFNQITIENLIDNVLGTLNFTESEKIIDRKNVIYKNNKLNLKFTYREGYIGVDDSYNTNNIYSGDAPIKLFIQVNTITDLQDYSFDEVIYLLKNLAREDGILKTTEKLSVYSKDAVKMEIVSEDKLLYSLYVVNGNVLYKLIFMAEEEIMNEIGDDLFNQVIASIEL